MAEMQNGAEKLQKVLEALDGKKILVLGYGREGRETVRRLLEWCKGAEITVADLKEQALPEGVDGHSEIARIPSGTTMLYQVAGDCAGG